MFGIFKNFRNIRKLTDGARASERLIISKEHGIELHNLRNQHRKEIDKIENDFEKQRKSDEKKWITHYEGREKDLKKDHKFQIEEMKTRVKDMEDNVMFSQRFWSNHLSDVKSGKNIITQLKADAQIDLDNAKDLTGKLLKLKIDKLQTVEIADEKMKKISDRALKCTKDGEELLGILEEEDI